jgi:YD repeat-containing protein
LSQNEVATYEGLKGKINWVEENRSIQKDGAESPSYKATITYAFNNPKLVKINYTNGRSKGYECQYNDHGISSLYEIDNSGSTLYGTGFSYDDEGRLIKIRKRNNKTYTTTRVQLFAYQDSLLVEDKTWASNYRDTAVTAYTYHPQGQLISKKRDHSSTTYTYNSNGLVSREVTSGGILNLDMSYSYDAQGSLIKTISSGGTYHLSYEYDAQGNWIKKTSWDTSAPNRKEIITRVIHYSE